MLTRKLLVLQLDADSLAPLSGVIEEGWEIVQARGIDQARELKSANEDCVVGILAINRFSDDLLEDIEKIFSACRNMEWIALLPADCMSRFLLCKFVAHNFYDYHTLPPDLPRLLVTLGRAYGKGRLKDKLRNNPPSGFDYQMIGNSPVMRELFSDLAKIRHAESPVLIRGESGTGKELAARAIHRHSARHKGPFIAVNCGALPIHLIQSELFGHEKGAFTGANQRKIGHFEAAGGGTILLDEIGDLPLNLQVNLLRFLQEKTIERIGSTRSIPLDVRVIAATHVNLEKAVKEGTFREDLYYRLNVLHLKMPPLREREGDIELLAITFFEKFSREQISKAKGFSKQAMLTMRTHDWQGNVRELINRVQRAVIMTENTLITPADLGLEKRTATRSRISLDDARDKAEMETIQRCLKMNGNNVSQTARHLGVSRVTLYRLMNKFNIV
ncbi:MAG: sigma-54 dependent transcriptional regulator [Syntrophotaleaceae bacterium]